MYTHPWWIHWRSQENEFLHVVLAAYSQYECVLPRLDSLREQTPGCPSWDEIAGRMMLGKDQMDRIRRRTRRTARFRVVADAPFAPKTGGLSFGLLTDFARFFGTEVSEFIPPLSIYYTGATRLFIQKVLEESGNDRSLPNEVPPTADIWSYAQYYIALKSKFLGSTREGELDEEAVAEVMAKNGNDAYFTVEESDPFAFENIRDVEEAILRTRTVLENLLAWLEARNLFHPRWS